LELAVLAHPQTLLAQTATQVFTEWLWLVVEVVQ
jgi:hypothetical protein